MKHLIFSLSLFLSLFLILSCSDPVPPTPLIIYLPAVLAGDYIIYWQDGDIKTVSVVDGTTDVIAQATGMRAWPK